MHHLPLPMPPNKLPQCLHRGIRQITGRKSQGTFQGSLPHPPTQHHHRTPSGPRTVQHCPQRCQQPVHDHQGCPVHTCAGPNPQKEPRKVPPTAHMGPPSNGISVPAVQAFQPSNYTYPPPISPLLFPPPSYCPYRWGHMLSW